MSWLSMKDKHRIKDIYVKMDDGLHKAVDCYVSQGGQLYRWARPSAGGIAILLPGPSFHSIFAEARAFKAVSIMTTPPATFYSSHVITDAASAVQLTGYIYYNSAKNRTELGIVVPDGVDVYLNSDSSTMFSAGFASVSDLSFLSAWHAENVVNFSEFMKGCGAITSLSALSSWDVSNATDMSSMFYNCTQLASTSGLSSWNATRLINVNNLFRGCRNLTDLSGIEAWSMSSVEQMRYALYGVGATKYDFSKWQLSGLLDGYRLVNAGSGTEITTPKIGTSGYDIVSFGVTLHWGWFDKSTGSRLPGPLDFYDAPSETTYVYQSY